MTHSVADTQTTVGYYDANYSRLYSVMSANFYSFANVSNVAKEVKRSYEISVRNMNIDDRPQGLLTHFAKKIKWP